MPSNDLPNSETSPVKSLRAWLQRLAETGRAGVANSGVALEHELAAIAKRLDGDRAVIFPQPGGHDIPVFSGIVSNRSWIAEAMGESEETMLARFQHASLNPLSSHEVTDAPVHEVVHKDAIDLRTLLPIPTHSEHDNGPYISAGLLISRNPENGIQNVSINRLQVSGPNRLGVLILPRHTHYYHELAERTGADLPIAIVIGVDPLTLLASQAILPVDHDELEVAGALHGQPLDVVKCTSSDVRVPAHAEIVIEGRILANVREKEGPFAEFPQYYGPPQDGPVIEIDAITHRRRPLFQTIVSGGLEHLQLGAIPREATLLAHLQRSFVNVLDVHLGLGGVGRYHLYVKIRARQAGEARNILLGALSGHYDLKQVIIVDEDVDIYDPREIEWAVATRFQADRDLIVIPSAQGSKLDPSASDGVSAKMGIDATIPWGADAFRYKRIRVPGEEAIDPATVLETHAASDVMQWLREGD